MIDVLAALSASAAGGMRVALPLLLIGLLQSERLWSQVPILARLHPQVVISILVSWSLFELVAAKSLLGQRVQQNLQLFLSPLAGSILGLTVANNRELPPGLTGILGGIGGMLALVIYLVQAGWFYRLRGIPFWVAIVEDILCVSLVCMAFGAPRQGGIVALLLLWLALRTSSQWRNWYIRQGEMPQEEMPQNVPPQDDLTQDDLTQDVPPQNAGKKNIPKISPRQGKLEPD